MKETKNNIIEASIELWANYPQTSLDDIANHIGISRRTLHRHFNGRQDLEFNTMKVLISNYRSSLDELIPKQIDNALAILKELFANDLNKSKEYLAFKKLNDQGIASNVFDSELDQIRLSYQNIFEKTIQSFGIQVDNILIKWIESFYIASIQAAIECIQANEKNKALIEEMAWKSFEAGLKTNIKKS